MDFKFEKHLTYMEMENCPFPTSSDFLKLKTETIKLLTFMLFCLCHGYKEERLQSINSSESVG